MTTTFANANTEPVGAPTYPYYIEVDPRELRAVGNSRDTDDIRTTRPDLVSSVIQHGIDPTVSVINVSPDPDGVLRVITGFSRAAAAVTVKERERPDLRAGVLVHKPGTRLTDLIAQGVENLHRQDFTELEAATLCEQLSLEGMDDETIAETLNRPIDEIRNGHAVVRSPRTRAAAQQLPEMDMFTLAKLAEFADDPEAHDELVETLTAWPTHLNYTIAALRNKRERKAAREAEVARLTELGYTVIDDEDDLPDNALWLSDLCPADDDTPITSQDHATCPARAVVVYVDSGLTVEVLECCLDYREHGHRWLAEVNVAATEQQLLDQGVRIVAADSPEIRELDQLTADDQSEVALTLETHADCPGHAAFVDPEDDNEAVVHWICDDPAGNGHVIKTVAPVFALEPTKAYKAGELKRTKANNDAWKIAKQERREWLTEYFSGWRTRKESALPARVHHWLARAQILASDFLEEAAPAHAYACDLLGLKPPSSKREEHPIAKLLCKKNTTAAQAIQIHLALVIGACEQHWNRAYTDNADSSWRTTTVDSRFSFELFAAMGRDLVPVEQLINNPAADAEKWPHLAETADPVTDAEADVEADVDAEAAVAA